MIVLGLGTSVKEQNIILMVIIMKQNCIFAEIFTHCDSCWRQRDGSKMVFFGSRQEESYFDYVEFYGGPTQRETQKHQKDNWVFSQRDFTSSRQIDDSKLENSSIYNNNIDDPPCASGGLLWSSQSKKSSSNRGCFWLKSSESTGSLPFIWLCWFSLFPDASSHLISFDRDGSSTKISSTERV